MRVLWLRNASIQITLSAMRCRTAITTLVATIRSWSGCLRTFSERINGRGLLLHGADVVASWSRGRRNPIFWQSGPGTHRAGYFHAGDGIFIDHLAIRCVADEDRKEQSPSGVFHAWHLRFFDAGGQSHPDAGYLNIEPCSESREKIFRSKAVELKPEWAHREMTGQVLHQSTYV